MAGRFAGFLVAVALLFVIYACTVGSEEESGQGTLERLRQRGVARVGFANEVPYAYLDSRTGEFTGEGPEIARVIFEQLGVPEIEGVLTEFGALIPGLKAERFDVIAAGMAIKPGRCREIDFSEPTYCIGEGLLVEAGNPLNLHSYRDIKTSEKARIGIVAGNAELNYARQIGIPEERIVVFPDHTSAVAAVQAGQIHGYASAIPTVNGMLDKADDPSLALAEPFKNPLIGGERVLGCAAFGFREADDTFREKFNRHLVDFVGTEEHIQLIRPFGFTRNDLPGDATARELCGPGET